MEALYSQIMNGNNWGPAQPNIVEAPDWRTQVQENSRLGIVNKIMDTLKRHLPIAGPEGLVELKRIAVRFEEKIYSVATSQSDYLRKISLKMLMMETKSQNTAVSNSLAPNPQNPTDPGKKNHKMQKLHIY